MKKLITTSLFAVLFVAACGKDTGSSGEPVAEANFHSLDTVVFGPKCLECHGAGTKVPLTSYAEITNPKYVKKGDAANSKLYQLLKSHQMPAKGRAPLSEANIAAVGAWIDAGAKESPTPTTH